MPSPVISGGDPPETLRQYRSKIFKYLLLTEEKEKILGEAVRDGQVAELGLDRSHELLAADYKTYSDVAEAGEKAKMCLMSANLRLAASITRDFTAMSRACSTSFKKATSDYTTPSIDTTARRASDSPHTSVFGFTRPSDVQSPIRTFITRLNWGGYFARCGVSLIVPVPPWLAQQIFHVYLTS